MNKKVRILISAAVALLVIPAAVSAQLGQISGVATESGSGLPIDSAQVGAINMNSMTSRDTWTDSTGYFFIDSLTPGYHIVGAHQDGYEENTYPGLVEIISDEHIPAIDIELTFVGGTGYGSISGQVLDSETGLLIPEAGIDIIGFLENCCTDSSEKK